MTFLKFYRKPQKPTVSEAIIGFYAEMTTQGHTKDQLPNYYAINRQLNKLSPLVRNYLRMTGAAYNAEKCFIRRDWGTTSNVYWVCDGHSFKAKVRHPEHGQPFVPEVTLSMDCASGKIVGWAFSLSENQIAVAECWGNAMLSHGKPLICYTDNGAGQTAKIIDCEVGGMMARYGIDHQTGIPGNPQGRGIIEGVWDIILIRLAKKYPTFQGTGMDKETLNKNTRAINSAKKRGEVPDFVPSWQEFMADVIDAINEYNHHHKHSRLKGKTPAQAYEEGIDPLMHATLTPEEIENLYRPHVERKPARGEIRLFNNIYFNQSLVELPANSRVRVAFDLNNAEKVWVQDLQGRFIGEAIWNGNQRDAFPKTHVQRLKDNRIDGQLKLVEQKTKEILAQKTLIEHDNLIRDIPKPAEPKRELIKVYFAPPEPEHKPMTRAETKDFLSNKG